MLNTGSSASPQYLRLGSFKFAAVYCNEHIAAYRKRKQVTLTLKDLSFFFPTNALDSVVVRLFVRRSSKHIHDKQIH